MSYYTITAKAGKKAEIMLYDTIGSYDWMTGEIHDAKSFRKDLLALGSLDDIDVRIHSPGGDVFEGNAIANALEQHPAKVTVYVDGLAASIASVIAMVGDERHMAANAMLMIHNPAAFIYGGAAEMERMVKLLGKVRDGMLTAYDNRSNMTRDEIAAAMDAETWYTAEEALAAGFITHIDGAMQIAACALPDCLGYRQIPQAALALVAVTQSPPTETTKPEHDMSDPTQNLKAFCDEFGMAAGADYCLKGLTIESARATHAKAELATIKAEAEKTGEQIKAAMLKLEAKDAEIVGLQKQIEALSSGTTPAPSGNGQEPAPAPAKIDIRAEHKKLVSGGKSKTEAWAVLRTTNEAEYTAQILKR